MAEAIITKWNGGITNDPYNENSNTVRICTNFDNSTIPSKLIPYRSSESGDTAASTSKKQNFCIAYWGGTSAQRLFSLGVVSGTGKAEVLMKDLTNSSNDLADGGWLTPTNNQSSAGTTSFNLFVYYKRTGLIYGARANSAIWAFDPTSSGAWADTSHSLTYTTINQGIVHSKDDRLYIPYYNSAGGAGAKSFIARYDGSSWSDTVVTLPDNLIPVSICEYGNYLAIGCASADGVSNSIVYLWDRDTSLTTLSESINWGDGQLTILEEINGNLIGVSLSGNSTIFHKDRIIFRVYTGNGAEKFAELTGTTTGSSLPSYKQKLNNRLYFLASLTISGSVREGLWSIGKSFNGSYIISHERTPNNDTALTSGTLNGFFIIGDFVFISYSNSGTYALSKTDDQATYSATSIIETTKNPSMLLADRTRNKELKAVIVTYEPLPSGGQVVLKYRVDGGSYTTLFTETTANTKSTSIGGNFTAGRDYEFRLESTGGAEIVNLRYKYGILPEII